ncbi:aminotransferase class IV [Nocardioides lianchengensis]|uniref:Branched-chain amino acid aminotransferase n=1 Tax=Nocardioides lianchengensis TaxID=1045774 RepID=A0A1G6YIX7_9ACTN|nr:aminotransferase class IV [Nocardioides lianchengensis]NYG09624.1 branched-chain amino acid aminotransferase [Nocardioides lianchengensis]SDD90339.1 branched-chain amino acid aminotransferase [Nocardioides lianchengensis]
MNRQVAAGDGVFEAVKVVGGRPFALDLHLQRLARGAAAVGLPLDANAVRRQVAAALAAEHLERGRLRITCTGAGETAVTAAAMGEQAATTTVVTAPWPRNQRSPLAGLKATAYADNVLALAHARERGAGEAVLADLAGHLCEGTTANVFYVVDGELRTPTLATGCLPGVTRALVLEWYGARELDEPLDHVRERASEVFLAGTVRDVQGVSRWDDRELPAPGPVTREVRQVWASREPELLGF